MIQIKEKKDCCGCSACVQKCPKQCISLVEDSEGFLYPEVDESICIDCGLCEKVCPVLHQGEERKPLNVYAARNKDEEALRHSSSGGIFTLLAKAIINDGGVVFGARFDRDWNVIHSWTETIEGISVFCGSKYVQSSIGDTYREARNFLNQGRKVLFSGTPCQILGLKKFLTKEYDKLYCIDVICHGVPSPGIWHLYLNNIFLHHKGATGKKTVISSLKETSVFTDISFRDKTDGWRTYSFLVLGKVVSKSEKNIVSSSCSSILLHERSSNNLYMRGFLNNLYLRPSCHKCPARKGKSESDILLGDFWGILRRHPEFYNPMGVSLVLVYTEKGKHLFNSIDCDSMDATYDDALDSNINIEKDEPEPKNRNQFFRAYKTKGIYAIDKYCKQLEPKVWHKIISKLKYELKRIIQR